MHKAQHHKKAEERALERERLDDDVKANDHDDHHREHREHHPVLHLDEPLDVDPPDQEVVARGVDHGGHAERDQDVGQPLQGGVGVVRDEHLDQDLQATRNVLQRVACRGAEQRGPWPHVKDKEDEQHKDGERNAEDRERLERVEPGHGPRCQRYDRDGEKNGKHEGAPEHVVRAAGEPAAQQRHGDEQLDEGLEGPPGVEELPHRWPPR